MIILRYVIIGLQLLLLMGAYGLKRLFSTKMGVMRHVVMLSNKWRAVLNFELVFILFALLLIALGLWQIKRLRRSYHPGRRLLPWIWLVLLALSFLLFAWLTLNTWVHVNVVILPILWVVLLLQLLQCSLSHKKRE